MMAQLDHLFLTCLNLINFFPKVINGNFLHDVIDLSFFEKISPPQVHRHLCAAFLEKVIEQNVAELVALSETPI